MKLDLDKLSIIPATPRYAKDHQEIYRQFKGYLDSFLDIDKDVNHLTFRDHSDWIQSYKREKNDHPTFFIKYWNKVVGVVMFREPYFVGGVQVIYFVNKKYSGRGLTTVALEHLLEVAFYTYKFLHVELHIDIDNVASQKVAQKLGFEVIDAYDSPKMGIKGSGHIETWAKTNHHGKDFWRQIPKENWMTNNDWRVGRRHTSFRKKRSQKTKTSSSS